MKAKKLLLALSLSSAVVSSAQAATIGVAMSYFDDNYLTIVRNHITQVAKETDTQLQFEDAQGDIGRQISQVQNFIASNVDAMIVNPVDAVSTAKMIKLAVEAKIPLVFLGHEPETKKLPEGVAYVGSDEKDSGTLEMKELARLAGNKGNVVVMMGDLGTHAAQMRTKDVEDVVAQHPDMKITEKQSANFFRNEGIDLMTNWLTNGTPFNIVAANNDEMAIGAIIAMQQAGIDPKPYFIGGVDATPDALSEMEKGNLDVTVLQDPKGQSKTVMDTALKMIRGEKVEQWNWVPFQLVTQENYKQFMAK
ncbi:sugar ABC transporter substrate-binding protein [Pokkaliibacter sp. MBI-7]|uniref:sugar ABC transporter substrate-binding protein n=1 Tax=Pokkaliibacter sp. MBI-7 TaxID=3040600 RepID=UPI00244CDB18|nr:sugar ABC transporter substrate-binding protein [Pokkaliibacter sp. MBI-7]MDH2436182.1 sugar ABC transporter substrate-binding protein [Pokkaliibacter sp. MBI-7]